MQSWRAGRREGDLELQVQALGRAECPEGIVSEAALRKEAVIRVAVLSRASLEPARVEALLAGETRANVVVGALESRAHRQLVAARARALFAEKPTVTLAHALVGEQNLDAETRVNAAILLAPRFEQQTEQMQRVLLNLPGQIGSREALEALVAKVGNPQILDAVAATRRVGAQAQERIMEICVVKRLEEAKATYRWVASQLERRAEMVLTHLSEHPELSERVVELAQSVQSQLGATGLAALAKLSGEVAAEEAPLSYEERVAKLRSGRDWGEVVSLTTDAKCPSSLLVEIAPQIGMGLASSPELLAALRQRAGEDELLLAVAEASPSAFILRVGWEVFSDPEAARRQVIRTLDGRALRNLASEPGLITTELVSQCSWEAVGEYAAYTTRGCPVAAALGALQRQALGRDASRWEVFGSLAEGFEGSVAELLTACANVLGEELELDLTEQVEDATDASAA